MSLGIDFPAFGATNPFTGTTPASVIDTYNTALENNGLPQPLGSVYFAPLNPAVVGAAANGSGLQAGYKYVRYNPTTSQTIQAGPALVYWKDETFTTVTPLASEAYNTANSVNSIAGWLLPNTTTTPGLLAATLNGNACWIQIAGFLSQAYTGVAVAAGISLQGGATGATAWASATPAVAGSRPLAWALTAAVSTAFLADLYIPLIY